MQMCLFNRTPRDTEDTACFFFTFPIIYRGRGFSIPTVVWRVFRRGTRYIVETHDNETKTHKTHLYLQEIAFSPKSKY
jgi:hypothetical protein